VGAPCGRYRSGLRQALLPSTATIAAVADIGPACALPDNDRKSGRLHRKTQNFDGGLRNGRPAGYIVTGASALFPIAPGLLREARRDPVDLQGPSTPGSALSFHAHLVRAELRLGEEYRLLFGLSFGYPDWSHDANGPRTARASPDECVEFHA